MKTLSKSKLKKKKFNKIIDNKLVELFFLKNAKETEISITNYGARIVSINVLNKKGKWVDIVLGKNNINDYLNEQEPYLGAICGRTANRIANANFPLDGKIYHLAINDKPNNLHGGIKGFHAVVWNAHQKNKQTLELTYLSKDGEEGYPGNLKVKVIYELTDTNTIKIIYEAVTDKTTILNLTNHSYFNLSGEGNPSIHSHKLYINANTFLPTNNLSIPLGDPENVNNTPFDFRLLHTIGKHIEKKHIQLIYGNGYDHNFIINRLNKGLVYTAKVLSDKTGIVMKVYTTEPGVQFYTGNYLKGNFTGKNGHIYPKRSAFCLETQHYPDSIHFPKYPSTVLSPNEIFQSTTEYQFSVTS